MNIKRHQWVGLLASCPLFGGAWMSAYFDSQWWILAGALLAGASLHIAIKAEKNTSASEHILQATSAGILAAMAARIIGCVAYELTDRANFAPILSIDTNVLPRDIARIIIGGTLRETALFVLLAGSIGAFLSIFEPRVRSVKNLNTKNQTKTMTELFFFRWMFIFLSATMLVPLFITLSSGDSANTVLRISSFAQKRPLDNLIIQDIPSADETEQTIDSSVLDDGIQKDSTKAQNTALSIQQSAATQPGENTNSNSSAETFTSEPTTKQKINEPLKTLYAHTVSAGDTYGCIAENAYGSYSLWPIIYAANAGYPGYSELGLAVGATIQLPSIDLPPNEPKTHLCE